MDKKRKVINKESEVVSEKSKKEEIDVLSSLLRNSL